ncbi:hypothetical protein AB205_0020060, partial [Aquarana catesbeiana]
YYGRISCCSTWTGISSSGSGIFQNYNTYDFFGTDGQLVYQAAQQRECCGPRMDCRVTNTQGYNVLNLLVPLECCSCDTKVSCSTGQLLGYIIKEWTSFTLSFDILDPSGLVCLKVKGPGWGESFMSDLHYKMTQDWLIYTTNLTYSPTSSIPIIRTNPAVVPIMCFYYRHGNVSSQAIKPTWVPFSTTVSLEERLSFSLVLMTEDWSGPRSSPIYQLGDVLYIQASVDTHNQIEMILYVDRCVATISPDATSSPSYDIITDNGCLVDGTQADSSSAFIAPRVQTNTLQFTVDAFRFLGNDASLIYITCYLRAAAATQVPDSTNKACSYSKATNSWSAVEGPSSVCQCCGTSGTCNNPTGLTGGRSQFRRPRALEKREALDEPIIEEQSVTTLGPLLVIGPKQSDIAAAVMKEKAAPAELWVLVAVGCLSVLVVTVCTVLIAKSLKKPQFVLSVEK